jgi:hypothetical protein
MGAVARQEKFLDAARTYSIRWRREVRHASIVGAPPAVRAQPRGKRNVNVVVPCCDSVRMLP